LGKLLLWSAVILFAVIGIAVLVKKGNIDESQVVVATHSTQIAPLEIEFAAEPEVIKEPPQASSKSPKNVEEPITSSWPLGSEGTPTADRIEDLFTPSDDPFPYVNTVRYRSRVDWLKGRQAWIADYATHYKTSSHFIARSLHGKGNYTKQDVANGNRFTVLNPDKNIEFYLLVDLSRCKLWFYLYDRDSHKRILLKDYVVGLGKPSPLKASGLLTPRGKYLLGDRIVAYRPNTKGYHNGEKVEMIRIFGTRWIPFEKEIAGTTSPAKGFGLHGLPWNEDPATTSLSEDRSTLGQYKSDGCVRMASEDIEEIYAIIVTKPSYIELVNDFHEAKLPGEEAR